MTKISIYDIDFKEQGPKIPFEDITFEEVDTYSIRFENFMNNLLPNEVGNKIDFIKYYDKNNLLELKEIFGKMYPAPFVDAILKQKHRNDEQNELNKKLVKERRNIENELSGYAEIEKIFRQRGSNEFKKKANTAIQKSTKNGRTSQKSAKRKQLPKQLIAGFLLGASLTIIANLEIKNITHTIEAGEVNAQAKEFATKMIENGQIDLGQSLGVTTPKNYSDLKSIYAFYITDPEGFKRTVTTILYLDSETGEIKHYVDLKQFLEKNEFFAKIIGNDGEYIKGVPSTNEFQIFMENMLIAENAMIKNGQDESGLYEEVKHNAKGEK